VETDAFKGRVMPNGVCETHTMRLITADHDFRFHSASSDMRRYGASYSDARVEVSLILEGEVLFIVDGVRRTVRAPAASFQAYRNSLEVVTPRHRRTRTMWCYASAALLDDREWALTAQIPPLIGISDALRTLFDSALSIPDDDAAIPGNPPNYGKHIRNALGAAIFAEYLRCSVVGQGSQASLPVPVQKARAAIDENYRKPWEANDLAGIAGVNRNHLIHQFKKHLGISPTRYMWNRRVEAGVHLLRTTDLSVEEIAFRSGFQSGAHFSRIIKKEKGMPPGQLRRTAPSLTAWTRDASGG
jgi:AraC-like DNA-binding protein